MGLETVAIGALLVGAGSTVYSAVQAEDLEDLTYAQGEEQKKQIRANQKIADIKNIREQRNLVRKSRIQRAALINYGATTGTSISSGVSGAVSSIGAQTGSNLGYFSAVKEGQGTIFESQEREAGFVQAQGTVQSRIATSTAIGNLAGTVFGAIGGFKTVFKPEVAI